VKAAGDLLEEAIGLLDAEIDIPFISALYKWITGDELTLLSLFCLLGAVVVHVAYLLLTGREFGYDPVAKAIPGKLRPVVRARAMVVGEADLEGGTEQEGEIGEERPKLLGGTGPERPMGYGYRDNHTIEAVYVALKTLNIACVVVTDLLFAIEVPIIPKPYPGRDEFKIFRGLTGIASSVLMYLFSTPCYVWRVQHEIPPVTGLFDLKEAMLKAFFQVRNIAIFAAAVTGDAITVAGGVLGKFTSEGIDEIVAHVIDSIRGRRTPSNIDGLEYDFLAFRAFLLAGLVGYQAWEYTEGKEHSSIVSGDLRTASKLLLVRDMFDHIAKMPGFLFTQTAANKFPSKHVYLVATGVRGSAGTAALALHSIAEFNHLGH
jgi:hypothetical protein